MELHTSDTFNIDLQGDSFKVDITDMEDVQELNVKLQSDSELNVNMKQEDRFQVRMKDGGATGVDDYNLLRNKPSINGIELLGDKSNDELNMTSITNIELERILK